jgi:HlyD family secretion protein
MNAEVEIQIASREAVSVVPTMALRVPDDIPATAIMLGVPEATVREQLGAVGGVSESADGGGSGFDIPALIAKRRNGETLTDDEQAALAQARAARQQAGGGNGAGRRPRTTGTSYEFGGDYWVVVLENGRPVARAVRTGLTDLEYSEIVSGLDAGDEVLLLPSSSLFEQQARLQEFISQRFGGTPFQQNQGSNNRGRRWR